MAFDRSSGVMIVFLVLRRRMSCYRTLEIGATLPGTPDQPVGDATDRAPLVRRSPRVAERPIFVGNACKRRERLPMRRIVRGLRNDRSLRRREGDSLVHLLDRDNVGWALHGAHHT